MPTSNPNWQEGHWSPWSEREPPSLVREKQRLADEMRRRDAATHTPRVSHQQGASNTPSFTIGQLMDAMASAQLRSRPMTAPGARVVHHHSEVPIGAVRRQHMSSVATPRYGSHQRVVGTTPDGGVLYETVGSSVVSPSSASIAPVQLTQSRVLAPATAMAHTISPTSTSFSALEATTHVHGGSTVVHHAVPASAPHTHVVVQQPPSTALMHPPTATIAGAPATAVLPLASTVLHTSTSLPSSTVVHRATSANPSIGLRSSVELHPSSAALHAGHPAGHHQ